MNEPTEMQRELFRLTVFLVAACMIVEAAILFIGPGDGVPDILVGRILGWFEAGAGMGLAYWLQTSHSSAIKNGLVTKAKQQG